MVLVDTSVWIEYLERADQLVEGEIDDLLLTNQVVTAGLVLAELRQGCRTTIQVRSLREAMEPLMYLEVARDRWLRAGEIAADGAARGYKLEIADCLLATLAMREKCSIYTLDRDFERIPGLKLYRPRVS